MYGCDPECWSRGVLIVSMATSLTTQDLDLVSLSFHFSSTSLFLLTCLRAHPDKHTKLSDFSFVPHTFMSHWVLLGVLGLAKGITSTLFTFLYYIPMIYGFQAHPING